jgi:hypothetical protein
MSLSTIIILANLAGFTLLLIVLLTRQRQPRVTTITRKTGRKAIAHPTDSEVAEK